MSEALAKKVTPTQAFRSVFGPYRDRMAREDAARAKLIARQQRILDAYAEEMRDIWAEQQQEKPGATSQADNPA